MSATPKLDKHVQGHCESPTPSSIAGGHKASFRATKLARRARSFKEDFLEKISQMRSPGGCGTPVMRSHSPTITNRHATSTKTIAEPNVHKNLTFELNLQLRQVEVALKHFRDVVAKNKLEMLPGNGTIVLDTITTIHTALQSSVLGMSPGNQSSSLSSANHQVYQSLARLIKLCDDVLLYGHKALEKENASEVVGFVEDAVQNLVRLAKDKLSNRDSISNKTLDIPQRTSYGFLDISGQRNSLPDIPLTPRERQILEQTSGPVSLVRSSHSSESILRDSTQPPPKPPLPEKVILPDKNKSGTPPPIPPKKRQPRTQQLIDESGSSDNSLLGYSLDRSSLRSRSPEDSSSLLSASAGSLDSVLNQSRDEDEIRALMDNSIEETILHNDMSELMLQANGSYSYNWDDRNNQYINNQDQPLCTELTRFSNPESGIGNSVRSSVLSAVASCKNSSQQSSTSAQWSSCNRQLNNLFIKTESVTQNTSSMQKSESIIQNLSKQMESSQQSYFEATQKVMKSETSVQNITVLTSTSTLSNLNQLLEKDSISRSLFCDDNEVPPELPQKTRTMKRERRSSEYDNVCPEGNGEHLSTCNLHSSHSISVNTTASVTDSAASQNDSPENKPPPLPLKKKHIMAYMEMFGNIGAHTAAGSTDMLRHSVHTYNIMHNDWQNHGGSNHTVSMSTAQSCSFNVLHSSSYVPHTTNLTLPSVLSPTGADTNLIINLPTPPRSPISLNTNDSKPPALPPKKSKLKPVSPHFPSPPTYTETPMEYQPNKTTTTQTNHISVQEPPKPTKPTSDISVLEISSQNTPETVVDSDAEVETNILEELEVTKYLVLKKDEDDGHEIRGGHPEALIIHATKPGKNYLSYQEAFLTTYRTFLQPLDVVEKLQHRHQRFSTHSDPQKQRAAREAFSLLVRVVSELTLSDLDKQLFIILMEFVYQLLCNGDLAMAKALRVKLTDKYVAKQSLTLHQSYLTSITTYTRTSTLLDFKSEQVAEQMTLLDANLFMKIEIPEVLVWAREQNEERSPNLTCFTEHFNKMSYWARTRILEQEEAKDREKYVLKFIKIMKHLRKINNFNSYLALLSAIDSAPIRRLEWQKHITEGLKEYCALIDSSSSFRAYRQALSDTHPPCIPYIGLVLQDLTFVHIGNSDLLPDGSINFSKRWQQFSIVENMKKFKKETYSFKKHERIIAFFNNFDDYISEEAMWQISEKIKPRGGKKVT